MVSPAHSEVFCFGNFELHAGSGELRKNGRKIRLEGQPLQLLQLLLARPNEIVTREEIQRVLWDGDTFVDFEHSINAAVKRLRQALDDSPETPRFIETIPRRGYRFICPVTAPAANGTVAPQPRSAWAPRAVLAVSILPVLLAAAAWLALQHRAGNAAAPPTIRSVAVLPLKNLSGDPREEYFADGMTDALIAEFGRIPGLRVISLQSVLRYKKTDKTVPEIARELKVDAVLEGAVRRSATEMRLDTQLLQASPERPLWSSSFVRPAADVLRLQGEVAAAVALAARVAITPQQRMQLAADRQINPEAYQAFLRGRELYRRFDDEWFDSAAEYLQKAIELDPSYAPPYATLAEIYSTDMRYSYQDLNERATAAAAKALELDNDLAEAHAAQAYVNLRFRWDWAGAEHEIKRALELNPNSSEALQMYGYHLTLMGRFDEAIASYRKALDVDPLNFLPNERLGFALSKARRYDEAIAHLRELARLEPHMFMGHYTLAYAYAFKGDYREAMMHVREGQRHLGDVAQPANFDYGYVIAVSGNRQEALELIRIMMAYRRRRYLDPMYIAETYAGLGDKDRALQWLELGYQQHARFMIYLKVLHELDSLRTDPRFQSLMRRMNFPPAAVAP